MIVLFNQVIGGVDLLSGGEKITVELLRRWEKHIKISVIVPEHGLNLVKINEGLNVDYITLPLTFLDKSNLYWKYTFFIPLTWFIHMVRSFEKMLKFNNVDKIIFSSGDFFCNVIPAFLLKIKDKKTNWIASIFHIIEPPFKRMASYSFLSSFVSYVFQKFSFRLIKARADKVLVLNQEVKSQLIKDGFDIERLYVMGAGIDFKNIDNITSVSGVSYDACFMARLSPTKGISDIPKIWEDVIKGRHNSRLVIIGSGTEKEESIAKSLFSSYLMNKQIIMVGMKEGRDKYALMKSSKVFIFPSYEEGFAISILEAMACKLPVVAWDLPVYRSVYKDAIVTVPIGNIEMFSRKVLELLDDESLRKEIAERVYNFSRQYDWDLVAKRAYERINN